MYKINHYSVEFKSQDYLVIMLFVAFIFITVILKEIMIKQL